MKNKLTCPVCNGSGRIAAPTEPEKRKYLSVTASYDKDTDTLACRNCGGQTMSCEGTGKVPPRRDNGEPCVHEYEGRQAGNCYRIYTCKHCGHTYDIDSSG